MPKPSTPILEYIDQASPEAKPHLQKMYALLKGVCPETVEAIKWRNPIFEERRILFSFSAHKKHMNFYPAQSALDPFRKELSAYRMGSGSISIPYDKEIPVDLIKKIAEYRLKDVRENDATWM